MWLYEDVSILKINFSEAKTYGLEHIKIELIYKEKWNGHNFPLKYLGVKGPLTKNFRYA